MVVTPLLYRRYGGSYSSPTVPSISPRLPSTSYSYSTTPSYAISPRADESASDDLTRSDRESR
jgi:hypothetical protein